LSKRILHIGKYFHPFKGGIERVMHDLMVEQKKIGHEVAGIVHHHVSFKRLTAEFYKNIKIYRLPIVGNLIFVPIAVTAFFHLFKLIKKSEPDIIHLHLPNALCFLLLLSPYCRRIPWVVHWHSDVIGEKPDWRLNVLYPVYSLFERLLLSKSIAIVTTSPNYLQSSKPLLPYQGKSQAIPIGLADRSIVTTTKVSNVEPLNLICIGRFTYYKGQSYLLEALNQLSLQGVDVFLSLVGNGEDKTKLESLIQSYGLSNKCEIFSGLNDQQLEKKLMQSDVVCLPSIERTEAFGVVLLEAMRASKPCICTSVPGSGMSFVVENGKTGYVVEHSNGHALAKAIKSYIQNPELLHIHGTAGRKRFEDNFEITETARRFAKLYARF
jgi:rhamnosyl/mannosyltransferase